MVYLTVYVHQVSFSVLTLKRNMDKKFKIPVFPYSSIILATQTAHQSDRKNMRWNRMQAMRHLSMVLYFSYLTMSRLDTAHHKEIKTHSTSNCICKCSSYSMCLCATEVSLVRIRKVNHPCEKMKALFNCLPNNFSPQVICESIYQSVLKTTMYYF